MKKEIILLFVLIIPMSSSMRSQNDKMNHFKSNEHIAYCITSGSTPDHIVQLDNNWDILLLLKTPRTISMLDSLKIKYTFSQLALLEQWKLIKKDKKTYQTAICILDSSQTVRLRNYALQLSEKLTQIITPDVSKLTSILAKNSRERSIYSILFSYIMDGLVWKNLETDSIVAKRELTLKDPLWNGEFWTLFPKRTFYCGTNSISNEQYSIEINWSENSLTKMRPLFSHFDMFTILLDELTAKGKVTDPNAITQLSAFKIVDNMGTITLPIIVEKNKNEIYDIAACIADTITKFLKSQIDLEMLKKEFGFENNSQATIILYHEIIWDLLEQLEKDKIIVKPIVFATPDKSKSGDISDLILIIKTK